MYAIRENFVGGNWWTGAGFSPSSDEAMTWDNEDDALHYMRDHIDEDIRVVGMVRVVEIEDE